jgi:hypothetical protein
MALHIVKTGNHDMKDRSFFTMRWEASCWWRMFSTCETYVGIKQNIDP